MKKQISIEALNENMFMTIEMLLNNNDPEASENEKLKPEIAKQVIEAGKVIVSAYKIKADVICALATSGYSKELNSALNGSNLLAIENSNHN